MANEWTLKLGLGIFASFCIKNFQIRRNLTKPYEKVCLKIRGLKLHTLTINRNNIVIPEKYLRKKIQKERLNIRSMEKITK